MMFARNLPGCSGVFLVLATIRDQETGQMLLPWCWLSSSSSGAQLAQHAGHPLLPLLLHAEGRAPAVHLQPRVLVEAN